MYTTSDLLVMAALTKNVAYGYAIAKLTTLPISTVRQSLEKLVKHGLLSTERVHVKGRTRLNHAWTSKGLKELKSLNERVTKLANKLD